MNDEFIDILKKININQSYAANFIVDEFRSDFIEVNEKLDELILILKRIEEKM